MPATLGNEIALLPREKPYGPERAEEIEPRGSMPGLSKTVHRPLFVRKVVGDGINPNASPLGQAPVWYFDA